LQAKHIMGHFKGIALGYAQDNLGFKKVKAPSNNPKKCPIIFFCPPPPRKNNLQDFQNQRYMGIFMSLREIKREREKEREQEQELERARARKEKGKGKGRGKRKGKREREREREQKCRQFISTPHGPK
jgi:hypothetical protein